MGINGIITHITIRMKVTLANLLKVIISIVIIIALLNWLLRESSTEILLRCFTWLSFIIISLFISLQLDKIKSYIRVFVGIGTFIVLAAGYLICINFFPSITTYIHIIMTIIFVCFVLIIFLTTNTQKIIPQTEKLATSNSNPTNLIINGRIRNEEQLKIFYDNLGDVPYSFRTYVCAIYDLCARDKDMKEDDWLKIEGLTYPIVIREREKAIFSDIKGNERECIQTIYDLCSNSDMVDKNRVIDNLKSTYKSIIENQKRFEIEQKRNNQALFISWIGVILTVILSVLSILISLYDVSFNS